MRRRPEERVTRYLDALLRKRRPRRFKASAEELEAISAAAELMPARPGADFPDPSFVQRLEQKLRAELDPEPARPRILSRRALLGTMGTAAAAAVVGAGIDRALLERQASQEGATLVPNDGQWQQVASVQDLPDGHAMTFSTGSMNVVVVNRGGKIQALSGVCTHLGCVLRPNADTRRLDCPCHRTTFGFDGHVQTYQLAKRPADLPTVECRVRDGQIEVYAV
jgi:nitrite reductase/ring-hydroxylating ferredoxin subunit